MPNEVFLSHSSLDHEFATRLAEVLRRHGVPIWFSPADVLGAQQWQDEIGSALSRCDWFVVILSPNSIDSMWVKRETSYALQQNRYENRIVPLLYQDCDLDKLSWVLSIFQLVDFRGDFDAGSRDLLRIWGIGYRD